MRMVYTLNVSELIRQKIWSGDVILLGESEHEIRQSLIMNLGIDPVRAQVFNCVRTEYVFFQMCAGRRRA